MKRFIKTFYLTALLSLLLAEQTSISNPYRDEDGEWIQRPIWKVILLQEPNDDESGNHYYRKAHRFETKDIQKALKLYQYGSIYKNRSSLTRFQELTKKVN